MPLSAEGKATAGREQGRLPGVRVETWNGWPTVNRALGPAVGVTPGSCCSTFVRLSDVE